MMKLTLLSFLAAGLLTIPFARPVMPATITLDHPAEVCMTSLINQDRHDAGRPRLRFDQRLDETATRWAYILAQSGTIRHNQSTLERLLSRYRVVGENVGMGEDCTKIHDAFLGSPGHKKNQLDPDYTRMGVGAVNDADGIVYIVVDFGDPRSRSAAPRCR